MRTPIVEPIKEATPVFKQTRQDADRDWTARAPLSDSTAPGASEPPRMVIVMDASERHKLRVAREDIGQGPQRWPAQDSVPMAAGRWRHELDMMRNNDSFDEDLLDHIATWITQGVTFPLRSQPPVQHLPNSRSVKDNVKFVRDILAAYQAAGVTEEIQWDPAFSTHPLLVAGPPRRKPRLCLDLSRNFNDYCEAAEMHYGALQSVVDLATGTSVLSSFDISAYFNAFALAADVVNHMRFQGPDGHHFRFVRMPFGAKLAPRAASDLGCVVTHALARAGLRVSRYCDDFCLISDSKQAADVDLQRALDIISQFGLQVAADKTVNATTTLTFLGVVVRKHWRCQRNASLVCSA